MQEKKTINVEVGANIKAMRERAGLTQEQLSERIGIGVKSLSAIERGTVGVSLTTLRKVCEELSVSSDALLFGAGEENDISDIVACLERMSSEQLELTREMMRVLLSAFSERAKKYELLLVPSDSFGVSGYVRISYCVSKQTIINSLPSFKKLASEYKG